MFSAKHQPERLETKARLIILLNALYNIAESLCSVFVSVYFYVHSLDINCVFQHYITLYAVTPIAFIAAGWYAKAHDRTRVFRIGLVLHACYYASLLYLREASPQYVVHLGALLGVTWGFFWAGNNTFQFDVTSGMKHREYFLGLVSAVTSGARLFAPLVSGAIIGLAPDRQEGYLAVFATALCIYLVAIALSFQIPHLKSNAPFRLRRALFPPAKHRDWRLVMLASASLAGSFHIFHFLLAIIMYSLVKNEPQVGGYVSFQGLISITASYLVGRYVTRYTRSRFMFWGVVFLMAAGTLVAFELSIVTLILFALLRSISLPLFGIPHTGIRFEVMQHVADDPSERIEYICAWEVPLAIGRIVMMGILMAVYRAWGAEGFRLVLLLLCLNRIGTYLLLRQISFVRDPNLTGPQGTAVSIGDGEEAC